MRLAVLLASLAFPVASLGAGGHDALGCAGCHAAHAARGAAAFAFAPNTKLLDPRTGKPNETISALCLSCHADREAGGRGVAPVSNHFSHPFSSAKPDPKLVRVPAELLRGGRFECVGCHDPHPSNPNYRYLRIAVTRTPTIAELCTVCHPRKADLAAPREALFSSDERNGPSASGDPR